MTEHEEEGMTLRRRVAHFLNSGCPHDDAQELGYQMMLRDRENRQMGKEVDNRRVCFECTHLESNKYCNAYKDAMGRPVPQLRFVLQRCPKFVLRGSK